jgi:hypothetical protein
MYNVVIFKILPRNQCHSWNECNSSILLYFHMFRNFECWITSIPWITLIPRQSPKYLISNIGLRFHNTDIICDIWYQMFFCEISAITIWYQIFFCEISQKIFDIKYPGCEISQSDIWYQIFRRLLGEFLYGHQDYR